MKARVKATGKIVEVTPESYYTRKEGMYLKFTDEEGISYLEDELDFFVESKDPDYWDKLLHQYAGIAMQQLVHLVNVGYEYVYEETAIIALNFATALVEKLKSNSYDK